MANKMKFMFFHLLNGEPNLFFVMIWKMQSCNIAISSSNIGLNKYLRQNPILKRNYFDIIG